MNLLTDREYLGLTVPFMLSTMTQPLMGAVNTAVMGQLPNPKYIAAVSLGAILFNNLYWLFGFLRVSTTGYAAQAFGAADKRLGMLAFFKPLVLAMLISACCILFQKPILELYLAMIGAAPEVNELCRNYYHILIWGAPLVLGNYVALGWQTYKRTGRIFVMNCFDNLVKGAAGQAVQNMNVMFGIDETAGLRQLPLVP